MMQYTVTYRRLAELCAGFLTALALWQDARFWGFALWAFAIGASVQAGQYSGSVAYRCVFATALYLQRMGRVVTSAFLAFLTLYAITHVYAQQLAPLRPMEPPAASSLGRMTHVLMAWGIGVVLGFVLLAWNAYSDRRLRTIS